MTIVSKGLQPIKIWIDIDNPPHAHFLSPFIKISAETGIPVSITARQTSEIDHICRLYSINPIMVGTQRNRHLASKVLNTLWRGIRLYFILRRHRPSLSLSSSRSCVIASRLMSIPSAVITDYEHSSLGLSRTCGSYIIIPRVIGTEPFTAVGIKPEKMISFDGLKEDLYLHSYVPPTGDELDILTEKTKVVAVVRLHGDTAHYRTQTTADTQQLLFRKFASLKHVAFVFVPRNDSQRRAVSRAVEQLGIDATVLDRPTDGPALIRSADMVFSGGGTMIREAAVLGVPAYSYFGGKLGLVDKYLEAQGLLTMIRNAADIDGIQWIKKDTCNAPRSTRRFDSDPARSVWSEILRRVAST